MGAGPHGEHPFRIIFGPVRSRFAPFALFRNVSELFQTALERFSDRFEVFRTEKPPALNQGPVIATEADAATPPNDMRKP